jgi:hypothetical protein
MVDKKTYRGTGTNLQAAILDAHKNYKNHTSTITTLFTTKVTQFGVETGGFTQTTTFFAAVQETKHIPKPDKK